MLRKCIEREAVLVSVGSLFLSGGYFFLVGVITAINSPAYDTSCLNYWSLLSFQLSSKKGGDKISLQFSWWFDLSCLVMSETWPVREKGREINFYGA